MIAGCCNPQEFVLSQGDGILQYLTGGAELNQGREMVATILEGSAPSSTAAGDAARWLAIMHKTRELMRLATTLMEYRRAMTYSESDIEHAQYYLERRATSAAHDLGGIEGEFDQDEEWLPSEGEEEEELELEEQLDREEEEEESEERRLGSSGDDLEDEEEEEGELEEEGGSETEKEKGEEESGQRGGGKGKGKGREEIADAPAARRRARGESRLPDEKRLISFLVTAKGWRYVSKNAGRVIGPEDGSVPVEEAEVRALGPICFASSLPSLVSSLQEGPTTYSGQGGCL